MVEAEPNSRPNANVYANSHSWGLQAIPWIEEHKDDGMKVALGHTWMYGKTQQSHNIQYCTLIFIGAIYDKTVNPC